jgi:hypothetical protein
VACATVGEASRCSIGSGCTGRQFANELRALEAPERPVAPTTASLVFIAALLQLQADLGRVQWQRERLRDASC